MIYCLHTYALTKHVFTLIHTLMPNIYSLYLILSPILENAEKAPYNDNRDAEQPPDYN